MSRRRVFTLPGPGGPAAGQLVEIDRMLFSSGITGVDPDTGSFSGEPEQQFALAFRNLERLLASAGASTAELGLLNMAVPRPNLRGNYVSVPWLAMFPNDADRPARKVDVYPLPAGQLVQLRVVGVRGQRRQWLDLPGFTHRDPRPAAVRIGNLVFTSSIAGVDPAAEGELIEDPHRQIRQAFRNMETLVQQAGGTRDDIAHVAIFVRDRADNDDVLAAWLEEFPTDGNRAARKNIYDDLLKGGATVIQLQMTAVLGQGPRQNYEVAGAAKRHPNPLGVRLGNLLFSAGIGGQDPAGREVERQAARALQNMRALVEQAGGTLDDVALVSFTVDDYAHEATILEAWRTLFPDPSDEPARHIMEFGGRDGSYQVQVHMVAALQVA
jgi:enamine deaminase RidA (YjgF/YER057c/UK114 family)